MAMRFSMCWRVRFRYNAIMVKQIEKLGVIPSLMLGLGLAFIGFTTLQYIVNTWWPIDVARVDIMRDVALNRADPAELLAANNPEIMVAYLGAILVTITGLALPLAHYLNKRFGRETTFPPFLVTLRQAMFVGFWGTFCVWLQMNRSFGLAIALLVGFVFLLFEILLQIRTQVNRAAG